MAIPASPGAVTAEWLTQALRSRGIVREAQVTGFETSLISEGVGFIGIVVRFALQYDRDEPGAPASLVAKFPSTNETAKGIGVALRFYENEIRMYDEVLGDVPLRSPRFYYGDMRLDTNEFVLLVEDMAPARIGDQTEGCRRELAREIVPQMAAMHAKFWESPLLSDGWNWIPTYDDPCHHHAQASYQMAWGPFRDFVGDKLPAPMLAAGERLQTKVVALQEQLSERPRTLMHGDFRMDNLVFPGKGADGLTVLDWQITSRGRGAFDLGYFLTTSMSPADRRAVEEELIASYLETLAAGGVRGYGRDEFMRDYRITAMFCLVYTAIVIGSLDMGNDRGLALFNAMLERNTAMVEDLEAWAVV